ncbi:MAG: ATP-binding protein [Melioribacteraceae bacterium]|nr:ATP-binding protein [Melioribacteraceae bacterium]
MKGSVSSLIGNKRHQVIDFLFQEVQNPIIILGPNNEWNDYNRAAQRLFGYSSFSHFHEMLDKSSKKKWFDFLDEVKIKTTAFCQLDIHHPSSLNPLSFHITGYYDTQMEEVIVCMKEHQVNSTETISYADFFKHAKHGLILSNLEGKIVDINLQVESYFTLKREQIIGLPLLQINLLFKESKSEIEAFHQKLTTEKSAEMILRRIDSADCEKYFHFKTSFNDENNMYVTVIRDESEMMNLRKHADHVDSLSTLGQLAASIAHEIRNPMTSLKGFIQLLNQMVTEDGRKYIQVIESELDRMDEILNEFLVLSKPTNRTKQFVCITSLLKQVIEFMQPQAIMNNISIHFLHPENKENCILGDSYELKKVFINILKNAIEEMPNGGVISITQSITSDSKIRISINDEGKGMSKEQIHQVFLPFYTTKQNGTGLGLSHAVQTIESHGGFIDIESELNVGTTLHLYLPLYDMNNNHLDEFNESLFLNSQP